MPKKPPSQLQLAVSRRLRAIQAEMGKTDSEMAEILGVGRTTWTNWSNSENMPEEQAMVRLCELAHVTMDWLYRGNAGQLALCHAIRLAAWMEGLNPDEVSPEKKSELVAALVQ